jgi:hypothetical protein
VQRIGDWYLLEYKTYIKIYGAIKAPHLLPRSVPYKVVLQEIAYQTVIQKFRASLYRDKKSIWPPLPFWVESYSFEGIKQAQVEVDTLLSFFFREERLRRNDPKQVVKEYCSKHKHNGEYTSTKWEEYDIHCVTRTYEEVIFMRKGKPLGWISNEGKAQEEA